MPLGSWGNPPIHQQDSPSCADQQKMGPMLDWELMWGSPGPPAVSTAGALQDVSSAASTSPRTRILEQTSPAGKAGCCVWVWAWPGKQNHLDRSLSSGVVGTGRRRRNFKELNNRAEEKLMLNNTKCMVQLSNSVFTCTLQQMPRNNFFFFLKLFRFCVMRKYQT